VAPRRTVVDVSARNRQCRLLRRHRLPEPTPRSSLRLGMWAFRSSRTSSEFRRVAPISRASRLPAPVLNQGPFPPPALPGLLSTTGLSATPSRPACPSRASSWSSRPTTRQGFPCCVRSPVCTCCRHYPGTVTGCSHRSLPQSWQPSPHGLTGRPVQRPFRGLLSVHSRYGLYTRQVTHGDPLHRRLQPLRYLHDCSDCSRLER
jgi:hypothetical protein